MPSIRDLIRETHRRSLWQVLAIYAAAAWVVLEVVDVLSETLALPGWFPAVAFGILLVGLPIVLATAFVQERRPERGRAERPGPEGAHPGARAPDEPGAPTPGEGDAVGGGEAHAVGLRRWLTWRNALAGGVIALALWGLVAAGWLIARGGAAEDPPPIATDAAPGNRIAVLPFTVRGSEQHAYLREGLVDLLSTKLDGAGDLRTVDKHAILSALAGEEGELSPARGREIASRFGASLAVFGNLLEVGDRIRLTATLYDFRSGDDPVEATTEGDPDELLDLVDDLTAGLLAELPTGPGGRVRRIAAVTTSSLPALKAYLQGDEAFRDGRLRESYDAFRLAVAEDSLFALAHYRLSIASEWVTDFDTAIRAAEAAVRHASRLSERDQRLLEAFLSYRRGSFFEAERRYRSIVGNYPDDVEAWNHLGEVLFHYAPLHARSFTEARDPLRRVLSYETFRGAALVHLARIAAAERRLAELDSLVVAFLETNPEGDRELELLALRAWVEDDPERQERVLTRMVEADDGILAFAIWDVGAYLNRPDAMLRIAPLLRGADNPTEVRLLGYVVTAYALLAHGRWRAAMDSLVAAESFDPAGGLEHRALLALFPPAAPPRDELVALERELRNLDPDAIPPSGNVVGFFNIHDGIHHVIRAYLLGMLNARLDDVQEALALAVQLEAMEPPPGTGSAIADLALTVRAEAALAAGRSDRALAALDSVRMEGWYSQMLASPILDRSYTRFRHAELLARQGREREALARYEHMVESNYNEVPYLGIKHFRQARVLEDLGRGSEAAPHYRRFLELWSEADAEFATLVDTARARLQALDATGG